MGLKVTKRTQVPGEARQGEAMAPGGLGAEETVKDLVKVCRSFYRCLLTNGGVERGQRDSSVIAEMLRLDDDCKALAKAGAIVRGSPEFALAETLAGLTAIVDRQGAVLADHSHGPLIDRFIAALAHYDRQGRKPAVTETKVPLRTAAGGMTVKNGMTLFFHAKAPLSNWHPSPFLVRGIEFSCVEQFMMHAKALLFGDQVAAKAILATQDPKTQKALGRAVKGYVEATWVQHRKPILLEGCREKYLQNPALKAVLLGTEGTDLVEASPYDPIWGCGLAAHDPKILDRKNWKGLNLLGEVQQEVRDAFLADSRPEMPPISTSPTGLS